MRMKRKKNLDERIAASSDYLITMKNDSLDFQDAIKENHLLDFNKVFKNKQPVYLEIGCGKGQFGNTFAHQNPDKNILCVERNRNVLIMAIDKARENASAAGELIHFIHRDFFDFRHEYKFDEIITNMPVRGRMTKEELDHLYKSFFDKALEILQREAVIIMYTQELGFVKKQIRLHTQLHLLQETCMQTKTGFYLLVIGVKR